MNIAVLLPTRGILFTRTLSSLLRNVFGRSGGLQGGVGTDFIVSEGLKIPEAQNFLVEEGLKTDADAFLMIEEDNVLPDGAIEKMLETPGDIICIDYPVANGYSTICRKGGKILWCGLGCTLIYRRVFETLSKPIFRTDQTLRITDLEKMEYVLEDVPNKYGGHDILLGYYANLAGFTISQAKGFESSHLRSDMLGHNENNKGFRAIYQLDSVSKRQDYPA